MRSFLALALILSLCERQATAAGARLYKSGPIQVTADGRWVWVVNPDHDSVSRLDTADDSVVEVALAAGDKPRGVSVREDGSEVWVACHDSDRVYVLQGLGAGAGKVLARVDLPWGSGPYGLALSRDQKWVLVTLHRAEGLALIDATTRSIVRILAPAYQAPTGVAWMEDGVSAWVTHMGSGRDEIYLSRVDVSGPLPLITTKIRVFPAAPQTSSGLKDPTPWKNVAEGGYLFIRGQLAQIPSVSGRNQFWLPTEYHGVHEDTYTTPPTSTNQAVIRHIDLAKRSMLEDQILDKVILTAAQIHDNNVQWAGYGWDAHIAGPVDIGFSADGLTAYVVNEQSDDLVVVPTNTPAFKPAQATPGLVEIGVGAHPMGLAVSPTAELAYVTNELGSPSGVPAGRTVSVVDLASATELRQVAVAAESYPAKLIKGARLFYTSDDPRISPNARIACATCHPGGEQDRRLWELELTPGLHGPRTTQSLLGLGRTFTPGQKDASYGWGQLHLSGDRDEVQDFEYTLRGVFMGGTGFLGALASPELGPPNAGKDADLDALAAYVENLPPLRRSPHRAGDGTLSEAAMRGATFFKGSDALKPADATCSGCHDPALGYVDHAFHDVGQLRWGNDAELPSRVPPWFVNTQTLLGVWATPPYEGTSTFSEETIIGALKDMAGRVGHGTAGTLTGKQLSDLAEFVLSIDGDLSAADVAAARDTAPPRVVRVDPVSLTTIAVWFNEGVDPATATDVANWHVFEGGTTPVPVTSATLDAKNGDLVRLTTTLKAGCVAYTLVPGPILDLAGTATGGVANTLDVNDPGNRRGFMIGDTLTVTLGGSGYEDLSVAVHDAGLGVSLNTWTWDAPVFTPQAAFYGKGLVRFEWEAAFAAATGLVDSADILAASFSIDPDYGDAHPIEARRVLLAWNDVHNGNTRTPVGGVSWVNHIAPAKPWNMPGASKATGGVDGSSTLHYDGVNDVAAVADGVGPMQAINERVAFSGARITDAYRFWYDHPQVDYGHILRLTPGALGDAYFLRSEAELNQHGPVLTLTYRVGAAAAQPPPKEVSDLASGRPLLVVKRPAGGLRLSFEDVGADAGTYNVYEGRLGEFYSHQGGGGCNQAAAMAGGRGELSYAAAANSYLIVTASNCTAEGPTASGWPPLLLNCAP